jgi:hypothetical protein
VSTCSRIDRLLFAFNAMQLFADRGTLDQLSTGPETCRSRSRTPRLTGAAGVAGAITVIALGCCHDLGHDQHDSARSDAGHAYLYSTAIDTAPTIPQHAPI